ncbi:AraC family transcriptional regulator [Aurantiacibacter hainanensis]|uniref:AraC family transcriptional regulator n=1 Tax=Aurantiacibacter hainanensis TaxID=3076114 RepID=UPI0030C6F4E6
MHFLVDGEPHRVTLGSTKVEACPDFVANGPTSRALKLDLHTSRSWSVGLNPVGWTRFAHGSARDIANRIVDAADHPAFERLAPILDLVREDPADVEGTARRIGDFLCANRSSRNPQEKQVAEIHAALQDPAIGDVECLAESVGVSRRTLERLASRYFGFPPKTLLRRQRFLRSLWKFTDNPGRKWSASLDGQYVDQAHFVRDFRSFMDMTPSEYAQMPHPLLNGIFARRLSELGAHSRET